MNTLIYDVRAMDEAALQKIEIAARILEEGGLVVFPTETVYGLGANAMNPAAASDIYLAKGRPSDNPLIVHIAELKQLKQLARDKLEMAEALAEAFWPGPLTLVLPKQSKVPGVTTGGLDTVAVRMPENPVALELIRRAKVPVAAPSANLSGRPSPTTGEHAIQDLAGRVDLILIGETCRIGIESTILDLTEEKAMILRPGFITPEALSRVLGYLPEMDPAILERPSAKENESVSAEKRLSPKAPGMRYRHYAPQAPMTIYAGEPLRVKQAVAAARACAEAQGKTAGVLLFDESDPEQAMHDLFAKLREMDDRKVDVIFAGALDETDSRGFALMNRMLKSAGYCVEYV